MDIHEQIFAPGIYWCRKAEANITGFPDGYDYGFLISFLTAKIFLVHPNYTVYTSAYANDVWSPWRSPLYNSDLPQWRKFSESFGTAWLTNMLNNLEQSNNYEKFEYSSAAAHEGLAIIYKRSNTNKCVGIFIPGADAANDGRIFIINGIPNDSSSWICKDII